MASRQGRDGSRDQTVTDFAPRSRAFVRWTLRHGGKLWIAAVLLALPAMVVTARLYLRLNSDVEQLLPRDSASVTAIDELRSRMRGLQYLGVVVDAKDTRNLPAAEHFLDDLAARIRTYPAALVRSVKTGAEEERQFIAQHSALYADLADLVAVRQRIAERKRWEISKKLDLLLDDTPAPSLELDDITKKYGDRARLAGRLARGRFSGTSPPTSLLLVEVGGFSTGIEAARTLVNRVNDDIRSLGGPGHYAAGMQLGLSGDVAVSMEEISALAADLTVASVLVIVAVVLALLLYFRWWRCVPALFLPLLVATALAFALTTLPPFRITELNSNTAFLGSIIIGNGVNFGIVLLARYVEARRRGVAVQDALVEAVWGARLGTFVAAMAAGVAYASLVITQFRGFRQFGVIGGLGMLLCWGTSFLLMPPLVAWLDRGPRTAPLPYTGRTLMGPLARWVARKPVVVATLGTVFTIIAVLVLPRLDSSRLESDFSRLRRSDTWTVGEGYWGRKMDDLLGRYLSPTVILSDTPEQATRIATELRAAMHRPPLENFVSEVRAIDDVLPPQQPEKLKEVAAIRRLLTPATRAELPPGRLATLDRILGDGTAGQISGKDLPRSFTAGMRELDGSLGRAVLVFPALTRATWQGDNLTGFVGQLRHIAADSSAAHPGRVAGALPLSADIVSSIRRDGPLASAIAFVGVMALVVLMFRWSRYTVFVAGALVVGVLWLLATTYFLGVKINFVNFIAFPITFGIGVDYAVNIMSRYVQDGSLDVQSPIRSTGAAVGLCSMTTIIGYSSLLLAKNQGLFLFGLVAVIGEITCLVTALAVLPAALLLWGRRRARPGSVLLPGSSGTLSEPSCEARED